MEKERKKKLDTPLIVAVEGVDFLHLLRCHYEKESANHFWLHDYNDFGGDEEARGKPLKQWLQVAWKQRDRDKVKVLGVITDAEDDANATFDATVKALANAELPTPKKSGEVSPLRNGLATGVLVVPPGSESGCIEYCLLESPSEKTQHVRDCAAEFQKCAEESHRRADVRLPRTKGGLERWRAKVAVRALIAGSLEPGQTLGDSSKTGLWDFESGQLKMVVEFIEQLRSVAVTN